MRALTFMDQYKSLKDMKFSVVDVFRGAGFMSFWMSNNSVMREDYLLQKISKNADVRRFIARHEIDGDAMSGANYYSGAPANTPSAKKSAAFDGDLLEWYKEALNSPENKKVIFVHLRGSHVKYWYRFPETFEYFKDGEGIPMKDRLSAREIDVVNDYDNSLRYTDYILNELVTDLDRAGGESWLLYFSDHGEELYDFRMRAGRDPMRISKYMLDVPVILWLSDIYKKNRGAGRFFDYLDRPYELDGMIHTILDLAGIRTALLDETQSLVSDKYETPARLLFKPDKTPYLFVEPEYLFNSGTIGDEIGALRKKGWLKPGAGQ
jgi:heptose-I-phosphate ethanolaminephosphotransferase